MLVFFFHVRTHTCFLSYYFFAPSRYVNKILIRFFRCAHTKGESVTQHRRIYIHMILYSYINSRNTNSCRTPFFPVALFTIIFILKHSFSHLVYLNLVSFPTNSYDGCSRKKIVATWLIPKKVNHTMHGFSFSFSCSVCLFRKEHERKWSERRRNDFRLDFQLLDTQASFVFSLSLTMYTYI